MRRLIALIPLLAALCASPSLAATGPSDPCTLFDWHDFQFMGVTQDKGIESTGWNLEKTPPELAGSTLYTGLCAAIKKTDKGRLVMVAGADNKVAPRPIETAEWQGKDWVVTKGLNAGDKVIVDSLIKLRPGIPVAPQAPQVPQATTPPDGNHAAAGKPQG